MFAKISWSISIALKHSSCELHITPDPKFSSVVSPCEAPVPGFFLLVRRRPSSLAIRMIALMICFAGPAPLQFFEMDATALVYCSLAFCFELCVGLPVFTGTDTHARPRRTQRRHDGAVRSHLVRAFLQAKQLCKSLLVILFKIRLRNVVEL